MTIDREVNVYVGTQKGNDFVVTDNATVTKPKQVVELKCERSSQKRPEDFRAEFLKDVHKIGTSRISAGYTPAKAYAVAISCTQASHKLLFETEWVELYRETYKRDWPTGMGRVTRVDADVNAGIYIWWCERDID